MESTFSLENSLKINNTVIKSFQNFRKKDENEMVFFEKLSVKNKIIRDINTNNNKYK